MKNFKEIAEKCLAGELRGIFKLASGKLVPSDSLKRRPVNFSRTYLYQMDIEGVPFLYIFMVLCLVLTLIRMM